MALEAALEKLCSDLGHFLDTLTGLDTTVTEDQPESGEVVLVGKVSDAITEIESQCRECIDAAESALSAVNHPFDANRLRRSLSGSQVQFQSIAHLLVFDLLTYETISALVGFGAEHGHGWQAWVRAVRVGLEECRSGIRELDRSYLACWEEIAERLFTGPISLHTTNIGQQISAGALDAKGREEAGMT